MKKKFFVVIAIIVVLVILLTPVRMNLKDGGSVRYKALVYEVTKIHRLAPEVDGVKPYIDGFEIKIFGMTVYRETNELTNSSWYFTYFRKFNNCYIWLSNSSQTLENTKFVASELSLTLSLVLHFPIAFHEP